MSANTGALVLVVDPTLEIRLLVYYNFAAPLEVAAACICWACPPLELTVLVQLDMVLQVLQAHLWASRV